MFIFFHASRNNPAMRSLFSFFRVDNEGLKGVSDLKWLMVLGLLLIILFILLLLAMMLKIKISIHIQYKGGKDWTVLRLNALGGLITYQKEFSIADSKSGDGQQNEAAPGNTEAGGKEAKMSPDDEQVSDSLADMKLLLNHISGLILHIKELLKKVSISQFEWHTRVGTGDAATTGIASGAIWALKGSAAGAASAYMSFNAKPVLSVTPFFQHRILQFQIDCMFQLRIGNAILAGIKIMKHWKGGLPRFRTKPLSALSPDKANAVS